MKSIFKIVVWSSGLVLIMALAIGVAIFTTDPNEHKDWLITQAENSLGRQVNLDGDLRWTLYPWVGIEVNDVKVGNASGFEAEEFFKADYLHFRIKLLPLLNERYEIDTVQIHGAEINLEINKNGNSNWQDIIARDTANDRRTALPLAAIILGGVDIQRARLSWRDATQNQAYEISNLQLEIGDLVYGEPIDIIMGMDLDSSQPEISGNANLNGVVAYDLANERITIEPLHLMARLQGNTVPGGQTELNISTRIDMDLDEDVLTVDDLIFQALDTQIVGNIDITDATSQAPYIDTKLEIQGEDISNWFTLFAIEPLASQLAGLADREFTLVSTINVATSRGDIGIPDFRANLLGAEIKGDIHAANIQSGVPSIRGNLSATGPDLPTLLQVIGQFETGDKPRLESYGLKMSQLPRTQRGFTTDIRFDADLRSGDINIPVLAFDGVGLSVDGQMTAENYVEDNGEITGRLDISGNDLNQWLSLIEIEPINAIQNNTIDKRFTFQSTLEADLSQGNIDIPELSATILGADIKGRLRTRNIESDNREMEGMINASGPDLPELLKVAGQLSNAEDSPLTEYGTKLGMLSRGQKAFTLDASFDADMGQGDIHIPGISFNGIGLRVTSNLDTRNFNHDNGEIDGKLMVTGQNLSGLLKALDRPDLSEVLQNVRIDAGFKGSRSHLDLRPMAVNAIFAGEQIPNSPVKLEIITDTNINLQQQLLNVNNLSIKGLGLNINGKLNARDIMTTPQYQGQVSVSPFNLRNLLKTLNRDVPHTADTTALTRTSFYADVEGSSNHFNLDNLTVQLDDSQLQGKLAMTDFENPATSFDLAIDSINVDRYLAPDTETEQNKNSNTSESSQLPVDKAKEWNTNGTFTIGKLGISNLTITNVDLGLNAKDGIIKIAPATAQLYEGKYNGDIHLNASGRIPRLTINSSLNGVEIAPLLFDYMGKASLEGKSNISLALFALGDSTEAFKSSLSGQGEVTIGSGRLHGIDVKALLDQLEIMIESKDVKQKVNKGESTNFDNFDLTFTMNSGVATSEQFLLQAPGFNVTGSGTLANLNTNSISYDLNVSVDESHAVREEEDFNLGGYSIPVRCRGPLNEPNCQPEYFSIVTTIIQKSVVEKLLNNTLGRVPQPGGNSGGETEGSQAPSDPGKELLNNALEGLFGR